MELSLGLGSGYDIIDKQRKDEKHQVDDGTQIMTITFKGGSHLTLKQGYEFHIKNTTKLEANSRNIL